jgi:hypothetical protein
MTHFGPKSGYKHTFFFEYYLLLAMPATIITTKLMTTQLIGTLLADLCAIVWAYVGADLGDFIHVYYSGISKRRPTAREWQKIANTCAAYYPQGCEWLYTIQACNILVNWTTVMCHSIRHDVCNSIHCVDAIKPFATDHRIQEWDKKTSVDSRDLFDPHEYETLSHFAVGYDDAFIIAAIDSGHQAQYLRVTKLLDVWIWRLTSRLHFASRNFLGFDNAFAALSYDDGIGFYLEKVCIDGNVNAVKNLLLYANLNIDQLIRLCGFYWVDHRTLSRSVADELYGRMKTANLSFIETIAHRLYFNTQSWRTLAAYMVRKEGRQAIRDMRPYLTGWQWEEISPWFESIVENDDGIWAELGLE